MYLFNQLFIESISIVKPNPQFVRFNYSLVSSKIRFHSIDRQEYSSRGFS